MDDQVCAPEDEWQAGIPTITHPPSGSRVGMNVTLWGAATPGSRIEILDGTEPLASADVDDAGFWGAPLRGMPRGPHDFRVRTVPEGDHSECSAPLHIVVEAESSEKRRRPRPVLVALGIAIAAIAVEAAALSGTHLSLPGSSAGPKGGAPTARSAPTTPAAPAPARSWSFPALAGSADQTILALNNPGGVRAVIGVLLPGSEQRVTLRPQGEAEMELGGKARNGSIRITSTAPIIAERIVVSKGKTSTSYGSHR